MSSETVAIIASAIGVVLTLGATMLAAMVWVVRRIDAVDERLGGRIDAVDEKLTARIDAVAADVIDLKISVARLEGPPRHVVTASR